MQQVYRYGGYNQIMGHYYYQTQEYQQAINHYETSMNLYQESKDLFVKLCDDSQLTDEQIHSIIPDVSVEQIQVDMAKSLESLGQIQMNLLEWDKANEYLEQALKVYAVCIGIKSLDYINCLQLLSHLNFISNNNEEALDKLNQCIDLLGEINFSNANQIFRIYSSIIDITQRLEPYNEEKFNVLIEKSEQILTTYQLKSPQYLAELFFFRMLGAMNCKSLEEALIIGRNSYDHICSTQLSYEPIGQQITIYYAQIIYALYREEVQIQPQVINEIETLLIHTTQLQKMQLEIFGEIDRQVAWISFVVGLLHKLLNQLEESEKFLKKAVKIACQIKEMMDQQDNYLGALGMVQKQLGKTQESVQSYQQAIIMRKDYLRHLEIDETIEDPVIQLYQEQIYLQTRSLF